METDRNPALDHQDPETWTAPIRWFARRHGALMAQNAGDSEDLEQELWIAMLEHQRRGDLEKIFETGALWRVLQRRMIDYFRSTTGRAGSRKRRDAVGHVLVVDPSTVWSDQKPAWGPRVHTEPEDWVETQGILQFLASLSPEERDLLRRRRDGVSLREIGEQDGYTESRACQKVARVRRKYDHWRDRAMRGESDQEVPRPRIPRQRPRGAGIPGQVKPAVKEPDGFDVPWWWGKD